MTELAREYAAGLYELAAEEKKEQAWLEQLLGLKACMKEHPELVKLLGNMSLSREERVSVLEQVFRGQIDDYLLNFLKILCERGSMHEFAGCVDVYHASYNKVNGIRSAMVTTAVPLTAEQREALRKKLASISGYSVELTEKVDPSVLGGAMVEMDGKRYDDTLAHRLTELHRAISGQA